MTYTNKDIDESQFVPHAEARTFYTDFVDIVRYFIYFLIYCH